MNLCESGSAHGLVGESPLIFSLQRLINKAATNRLPVLLLGESGTGKEVVARAIHRANPGGRFIPVDCGALVGTLMESELFGHVRGSFSGAVDNKKGLIELADGGTAFLDEIGDLPIEMQVKLLRLVQEHEYRPVGALQWRQADLRFIAATHRDLKTEVAAGRFRQDLYFRLNVFTIRLPPLREHKQDIPLLVDHFIGAVRAQGLSGFQPTGEFMRTLLSYDWPGNVRELKHCIDRIAAMSSQGVLDMAALPSALQNLRQCQLAQCCLPGMAEPSVAPVISISVIEKKAIAQALSATQGERARAAALLGIGRTTLYRKMKEYGIA